MEVISKIYRDSDMPWKRAKGSENREQINSIPMSFDFLTIIEDQFFKIQFATIECQLIVNEYVVYNIKANVLLGTLILVLLWLVPSLGDVEFICILNGAGMWYYRQAFTQSGDPYTLWGDDGNCGFPSTMFDLPGPLKNLSILAIQWGILIRKWGAGRRLRHNYLIAIPNPPHPCGPGNSHTVMRGGRAKEDWWDGIKNLP